MDSVTRPVGHLPPSVYWRRRAIVLIGLAVLIALVAWACTAGGGGGDDKAKAASESSTPSAPAAPNGSPAPIGPGNTADPGKSGQPSGGPGAPGTGTGPANPGGTGAAPGATAGNSAGTNGQPGNPGAPAGAGNAPQDPALGGAKPCLYQEGGNATLTLRGDRPADAKYRVGEQVALTLVVTNVSGETCAVNLSPKAATVEVKSGNDHIWSPADCAGTPAPEVVQLQPGKSAERRFTFTWTRSNPNQCTGQAPALNPPPAGSSFQATATVSTMRWASKAYVWTVAG
ncbi:DUF4232 domain-containing protein [Uniformispora flossi]|uniref:DUF4232 domain-containing protein n=1 Tax=Uniformispora flossi TaxID=3390723 RepID=UPI003C30617B